MFFTEQNTITYWQTEQILRLSQFGMHAVEALRTDQADVAFP